MKKYSLAIYSPCHEVIYHPATASQLARVSLDFLRECEQEGLVRSERMAHGEYGYHLTEIRQLARIRRLRETLELDLAAVTPASFSIDGPTRRDRAANGPK
jgi:hypothetical protein